MLQNGKKFVIILQLQLNKDLRIYSLVKYADVAQLAEQLICNQQVIGSSPIIGLFFFIIRLFWTFSSVG